MNSKFWNNWIKYIKGDKKSFTTFKTQIPNEELIEKDYRLKLKESISSPGDFIILPEKYIIN